MGRTAHRLCRRAAGVLRDLSGWLTERAEALDKAGSYERQRPLRFETKFEGALRQMRHRLFAQYMDDLLFADPRESGWDLAKGPDRPLFINRIEPVKLPSDDELRRSLKAYRYER